MFQEQKSIMITMTWNKFKNNVYNLFLIFLGLIIITAIFYIRLLPRQARDLWQNTSESRLAITIIVVLFTTISIYLQMKMMGILKSKQRPFFMFFTNKFKVILDIVKLSLIRAYYFLIVLLFYILKKITGKEYYYFPMMRPLIRSFCKRQNYHKYFFGLLAIKIIPIIVFLTVFATEVIYYHYLNLTFKLIPILLIPLIEKIYIFILTDFYDTFEPFYMFCQSATYKHRESIYYEGRYYSFSQRYNRMSERFVNFTDYFNNYFLYLKEIKKQTDYYKIQSEHFSIKLTTLILTFFRLGVLYYMYWLMVTYKLKWGFVIY